MKVKDISIVNPKSDLKNKRDIYYVDTSSVLDGKVNKMQFFHKNEWPLSAKKEVIKNDILISAVRPNLKHNWFVKNNLTNVIARSTFIQVRVTNRNYLPRYVYYFLTSDKKIKYYSAVANSSATVWPLFDKNIIEEIELPTISIDKQQHIVDTILLNFFLQVFLYFFF